ncbi:ATP-binding cassette domain-containing protein [Lentiprolixibacter aurantiacus]|uniref:ATP-binding cassette domain-containing protein n=1 Tax=Lentiprolixibacter aurantiacus TaxID=2993939 RepID=A0AAE3SNR1_9FLAO|nr:ATP-binding cassette domain-containing protein [Lentiprolixibacter aurantiacus]MCX2720027.1 ATP-binding cassette domain-containing protein [Lentiprolixibacter aurantiacus]
MISLDIHKSLRAEGGVMDLRVNIYIEKGEWVTLYGPSGVGKTSTLRMLAGLMKPDEGSISVSDTPWFDSAKRVNLKPGLRNIGYVFQDFALFPNMTVRQNLEYARKKGGNGNLLNVVLEMIELGELQDQKPASLSGGQKQRVALARALVQEPKVLLLDEPLSALDPAMRMKLQEYLGKVHREFELTTLLVSHDISEISRLSDTVLVMEKGRVVKKGKPSEVFFKQQLSGKFKFTGKVISIEKADLMYVVHVLVQEQAVRVIATAEEVTDLKPGDQVMVASKAFNPLLYKLDI